ncbi:C-type lectin domain family 17, member A-like isoform X3 [Accipiter gentilis]|uniref:C-type lectin domain family 17, member A-like isoform X3 n=1 Tax=Astur gentilis TaxID=8957 RepID=UPI00211042DA|nr:C-type lectin domain family 17, member A-like isoform X3 [Accipiter gentilis]
MARQETYGNWLGPPLAPTKRLVRQAGIYSVAGKMTPVGDFRPASPDSFEDDYDDVSLSEMDRGHKTPVTDEDLQSQRSKGGTGVYILAGKPASPNPSQKGHSDPRGSRGQSRRVTSVTILYVLVALSFAAWVLLFALAMVKQMEIMAELKLLRSNYSENQANVRQELSETQREQMRMRTGMHKYYEELQDITALICRSVLDNKKCSAGWKIFEKSCYSFSTERMSWLDAKEICADQGAHLVIINSEQEQKFLKDNINSSSTYWLGVTDQLEEGTWVWTNGEHTSISYWNTWSENKDKDQKDCGSIGPGGIWNDDRCSHTNHWICEKSWNC